MKFPIAKVADRFAGFVMSTFKITWHTGQVVLPGMKWITTGDGKRFVELILTSR